MKKSLLALAGLAAAMSAASASAHEFSGSLTNGLLSGAGANVTDVMTIQCFTDPTEPSQQPADHLFIQLSDNSPAGGPISATALSSQGKAVTITDLTPADGVPSVGKNLKLTPALSSATFTILIHHTAAAADSYQLSYHCQDAANQHTGTSETPAFSQNQ